MLRMMFLMQSGAAMADVPPLDFRLLPPARCTPRPDEIVVCARDPEQDRLRARDRYPSEDELALPRAEFRLSDGATLSAEAEQKTLAPGLTSNRAMVRLKMKF